MEKYVWVEENLIADVHKAYPETADLGYKATVGWSLRKLLTLKPGGA